MLGWVLKRKLHFWLLILPALGAGSEVELSSRFMMRPLAVQIAMLADESSTLDCVSLSQRILRQQLELWPCHSLAAWPMCVKSRKAYVVPLLETVTKGALPKLPFRTLGKWSFRQR